MTDAVKGLILERASSGLIKDAAVKQGMRTLRDDGWRNVRTGVTTVAEVVRVTQEEVVGGWAGSIGCAAAARGRPGRGGAAAALHGWR